MCVSECECVCVCVCLCACACVRACVCEYGVCVCVVLRLQLFPSFLKVYVTLFSHLNNSLSQFNKRMHTFVNAVEYI